MIAATQSSPALAQPPRPALPGFLAAIASPLRWAILSELSAAQPLIVLELAERLRRNPDTISKHMAVLRKAGLVSANRVHQYSILPQFAVNAAERQVDFGHALLRLGPAN